MKEYKNDDITIVWKPKLCAHAGVCARTLPNVYKPKEKPWITIGNASTEALINQIDKCPSGALSYYYNNQKENHNDTSDTQAEAELMKNGPLVVKGLSSLKNADGDALDLAESVAFCRCGSSNNKPFCDGSHYKSGFKG